MATWARRVSAAQAKQPGADRRAAVDLPDHLPPDVVDDDQAALRSLGHIARERAGFRTRITVRVEDGERFEVEVAHDDHEGAAFTIIDEASLPMAEAVVPDGEAEAAEPEPEPAAGQAATSESSSDEPDLEEGMSGGRVVEALADTLVVGADLVAIFASVGAEALWANDAFATSVPIREADKIWLIELLDDWSKGHFEVNVLPALVQHGRWHGQLTFQPRPDDPELPVLASLVAHRDREGEIEAVTLVARDLRELYASQERMSQSGTRLSALAERASHIIIVVGVQGEVRYASPATTGALGLADGALEGTALLDRVHPDDLDKATFRQLADLDEDGMPPSVEVRFAVEDGGWRIIEMVPTDLLDNPAVRGVVLAGRDVTDRVEAVQRLADRAYTDRLTLLPNRMRLLDRLGHALHDAKDRSVVAVLFDVDNLRTFNERYGHAAGDELLRQIAHRLSDETRPQDVVARLSGSEFAMVMRKVNDVDGALVAADRIKNTLSEPYRIGSETVASTLSVGISVFAESQTADELLADADTAVGIAKEHGGDRIEVMTAELRSSTSRRRNIEQLLRRALTEGDGVEVHYQPIVDLETGKVAAAEALLRVHDDAGALLSPASFLEAAEHTGLIRPLGGQVLRLTCQQLAAWDLETAEGTPAEISVNVSPRQLSDRHFAETVARAIEGAGISPGRLCLEITESSIIDDKGVVDETVAAVRNMGVSIGLDDFGVGQSSLGYLRRFPLDFVKIDRELVSGLGRDESDTAIVRATVELAHSLGLRVIAVGVETEEQLEILQLLGVDRAQGFYYLPAVPAADVAERMRAEGGA